MSIVPKERSACNQLNNARTNQISNDRGKLTVPNFFGKGLVKYHRASLNKKGLLDYFAEELQLPLARDKSAS